MTTLSVLLLGTYFAPSISGLNNHRQKGRATCAPLLLALRERSVQYLRRGISIQFQVDDIDPILEFYTEHLPFEVLANQNVSGGRYRRLTLKMIESVDVQLCFEEREVGYPLTHANTPLHLEFAHRNLREFKQHLTDAGIAFREWDPPWTWEISVLDPYGNTLTFSRGYDGKIP